MLTIDRMDNRKQEEVFNNNIIIYKIYDLT